MKTTKHTPASDSKGDNERIHRHSSPPDHFKDRQRLPTLAAVLGNASPAHIVPANELDLANFYHL